MSFILDALKKSESDRQRQSGPSLFEVKVTPPRRKLPIWAIAIAVLLGINIIVVSWMLLRRPAAQQPPAVSNAPAAAPAPTARTAAAPSAAPAPTPAAAPSSPAVAASPSPPPAAAPAPRSSGSSSGSSAGSDQGANQGANQGARQSAGQTAAQGTGQAAGDDDPNDYAPAVEPGGTHAAGASGATSGDLPLYQQIVSSDGLPALHLDLHVFAARPQDRFVMINMHRVVEGDSLPNGVHVDAIRPDGVALSYRGIQFLLPRD